MAKLKLFLYIFLFLSQPIFCQTHSISGIISDSTSGDYLISANLYFQEIHKGTISNNYGFYSVSLPKGKYNIVFSYMGYKDKVVGLNLSKDTVLSINLLPETKNIDEVMVSKNSSRQQMLDTRMGMVHLPIKKIETIPMILGENDVMKTLQTLPGVQSGTEGSSGLYIRGGGPDQNLILLDGVPVYYINHLFGFLSVFNSDAIKNVSVSKGSFPAEYGGRLSSVIDINMKEGNINKISGKGSIGLVASKLTLEGPLFKKHGKTSFLLSGRRTYIDAFTTPLQIYEDRTSDTKDMDGYYFYDLNLKINHRLSATDNLYLSGYFGKDKYFEQSEMKKDSSYRRYITETGLKIDTSSLRTNIKSTDLDEVTWGNSTLSLRWNHLFGAKLFSNLTLAYTRYKYHLLRDYYDSEYNPEFYEDYNRLSYKSGISDFTFKYDFNYYPGIAHSVKYGISSTYHQYTPGDMHEEKYYPRSDQYSDTIDYNNKFNQDKIYPIQSHFYIQDEVAISQKLKCNLGLHASSYILGRDDNYLFFEPRFSARYLLNKKFSLKTAYAAVSQYMFLLSNNSVGMPTDLWVSTYKKVKPQQSQQISLGLDFAPNNFYFISLEGYYKPMKNLAEYKEGTGLTQQIDWHEKITQGKGTAYGVEIFAEKKSGKLSGWMGYTLAWSNRQFDELNNGETFHFKYDRRHDFSVVLNYQKSPRFSTTFLWVFGSGAYTTLYTQQMTSLASIEYRQSKGITKFYDFVSGRNNVQLPAYHRMDVGCNFMKEKKRGQRTFSIGVYNAYNQKNPYYLSYRESNDGTVKLKITSLMPILPYFNYKFEF